MTIDRPRITFRAPRVSKARAKRAAAPETFRDFIARVSPRYKFYDHAERLINVLQRVADGDLSRLMVFMPPRHGKSELVSRLFPAYYLSRHPERFVGINSYAAELAYTFSRNSRDNYTRAGGALKDDAAAVKQWETGQGGGLWAAGVGGPITGKGFHLGIIDDPLKNAEEAASETIRAKQKDWYDSTFYTRAEPGEAIVVVQTRWHPDDLSGWLLTQEAEAPEHWHVVHFDAIRGEEPVDAGYPESVTVEPDPRASGEALCPERYSLTRLRQIAKKLGAYFWDALFGQSPTPREGTLFKVSKLGLVDHAPEGLPACRGWDLGATEGAGDWTAGIKAEGPDADGIFYLTPLRFQHEPAERNRRIRQTAEMDGRAVRQRLPQDPGAAGKESAQTLTRLLAGFPVTTAPVSGSKELRAEPLAAQVNAGTGDLGNVRVVTHGTPKGRAAATALVEEFRAFPNGTNDDQVDGAADAFAEIAHPTEQTLYFGKL